MVKKFNRIIEIDVEESEKTVVIDSINKHLIDNEDYRNGNIEIGSEREGKIDIILYTDCEESIIEWLVSH